MLKIEAPISEILNRLRFVFKNEKIFTECIKDHNGVSFLGESLGPFKKGDKYKIEFFLAMPFIEKKILVIDSEEKLDDKDIQRHVVQEVNFGERLTKQDDVNFLMRIKEFRKIMEQRVNEEEIPKVNLDRYNSYSGNYIDNRLAKILKLSKTDLSIEEEKRLTRSEITLYNIISKIIQNWRRFFLNI